jgi:LacI family transcriptional regulator
MAAIAELAGVSITTVSHVVNKTRRVAPATEQAVLKAVAQCGYLPEGRLRSARDVSSQTIGLAVPLMSDPYLGELVNSLEQSAARAGYSILLAETHDDLTGQLRAVMQLLRRQVDGIILAPVADPTFTLEHAAQREVPVLLVDRTFPANAEDISADSVLANAVDQIRVEASRSTALLVGHLAANGHERIAMVSGKQGLSTTDDRVLGFRLGLREAGLPVDESLIVSGGGLEAAAAAGVQQLLALDRPPTAVVSGNNRMTIGVMRGLQQAGRDVPDDIALVGYDDFDWADLFRPRLTVIRQPIHSVGQQAVNLLLDRVANPDVPARRVVLDPQFMHRESCGCRPPVRKAD